MLAVHLGKAEYFRVGQLSADASGHVLEIVDLLRVEGESFLFIECTDILDGPDRFRLDMDVEQVLVQRCKLLGQHRIESVSLPEQMIFLHPPDAGDGHVLGDLHRIGAPGTDHGGPRPDERTIHGGPFQQGCLTKQPDQFLHIPLRQGLIRLDCIHLGVRLAKEEDHEGGVFLGN